MIYGGWNNFFIKINIQAFSTCFLTKNFFYKTRGDYFRFHLVFIKKKVTKPKFFLKKNRNRFKPTGFGSIQFFRTKTGLARFFGLAWFGSGFFSVWVRFGSVFSVLGL